MGTFITQSSTPVLFADGTKEAAPGVSLRPGWTYDNVIKAADANALHDGLMDTRTAVRGLRFDVTHYGAVGNGSSSSASANTTAIRNAITDWTAAGRGAELHFPKSTSGNYYVDDEIVINARDRFITGEGFRTTVQQATSGKKLFVFEGNSASDATATGNLLVSNLFMYQPDTATTCVQVGGRAGASIYLGDGNDQPVTGIHFRDCWFQGGSYGLHFFNTFDSDVANCEWEGSVVYGARVESGGRIIFNGGIFYDVGSCLSIAKHASLAKPKGVTLSGSSLMISMRGLVNITSGDLINIIGNLGQNMGKHTSLQADQSGVYVGSADVSNVNIIGNTFLGHATIGQKLQYGVNVFDGVAGPTNITIVGNNFADSNIVVAPVLEACNAIRIGNHGDSTFRPRNSTSRVTYDNGIDLKTQGRLFVPRLESDGSPTQLDDYEDWRYSGRASQAELPPVEIAYRHPSYGTVRAAMSTKVRGEATAAPTTGTWAVGDIVYNSTPAAAGFIGWVCTTAGTPGTWKTFGAISA